MSSFFKKLSKEKKFKVESEDIHTEIEKYLTEKFGEAGKKIHTGRSRNDQVLTAIRLYQKENLKQIKKLLDEYEIALIGIIKKNEKINLPGYTHMREAIPTIIKDWIGCFIDSNKDNKILLKTTLKIIDQLPLGSGAGFGIPIIEIDKEFTKKINEFFKSYGKSNILSNE